MTIENPPAPAPPAFEVYDAGSANWVVRKIVEARSYAKRVEAWAASEIRRAEREQQHFLTRFGPQLEQWVRQELSATPNRRSVSLPAGKVGFRSERPRLIILDDAALNIWCRSNLPSAIRVVETVLKTPLADHIKETGECPNGVEISSGGERFLIGENKSKIFEGASYEPIEREEGTEDQSHS